MKGIRLGKLFGIEIKLNPSWVLVFLWLAYIFAIEFEKLGLSNSVRYLMGGATSLLFFVSVLMHEFAHSLVARAFKLPVQSISLHLFGGVSQMEKEPVRPRDEFLIAAAGPLASILIGGILLLVSLFTLKSVQVVGLPAQLLGIINVGLGLFNLIPGFPIDGGRLLRAVIWGATKDFRRATKIAARIGQGIAALFIMLGVYQAMEGNFGGLWIGLIGFYLLGMARSSYQQVELQYMLRGMKISSLSLEDLPQISGKLNIADFLTNYIVGARERHFMIVDDNMIRGLVSLNALTSLDENVKNTQKLEDVMTAINDLRRLDPETEVIQALELMSQLNTSQLPVVRNNELLGFIGRDTLLNCIRKRFEFGISS